jgi:hypothetical protein
VSTIFNRADKDKYLEIARLLHEKTPLNYIARDHKVSGKTIGMIKRLMDNNYITIDPETNEAKYTADMDEIEAFLDELHWQKTGKRLFKTPTISATDAVEKVIKEEIAKEASDRGIQYLKIGKEVAQAYWKWAQKMGIPLEQAVKHDIGRIVAEALDFHARGKKLEKRIVELEDALRFYAQQVDPIVRLKTAANLVVRFLEFAALAELVGFEIEDSPLIKHYERVITAYLQGGLA